LDVRSCDATRVIASGAANSHMAEIAMNGQAQSRASDRI
jgi:hypothetical protein